MKDNLSRIESTKKLETDLDFNIDETIEIGVEQVGYNLKVNSQLRQNMMAQKEIVEKKAAEIKEAQEKAAGEQKAKDEAAALRSEK